MTRFARHVCNKEKGLAIMAKRVSNLAQGKFIITERRCSPGNSGKIIDNRQKKDAF
jgi:hypothetical protein